MRELVLPLYAKGGRQSIDPVVFFKLQLVLFFEDLGSERRLMEVVADRLSLQGCIQPAHNPACGELNPYFAIELLSQAPLDQARTEPAPAGWYDRRTSCLLPLKLQPVRNSGPISAPADRNLAGLV